MIRYLSGYKYQLVENYTFYTGFKNDRNITHSFIQLEFEGYLHIRKGYAWDGPSGPTIDTKNFMRGSLIHDALYQLLREHRNPGFTRKQADEILKIVCLEDGMSKLRAWWVYQGVRNFGGIWQSVERKPETAP